jgi:hypothetical protein
MAMKEKERVSQGGILECDELAICSLLPGGGGGAADSDQEQDNVSTDAAECATDKPGSSIPHPLDEEPSRLSSDSDGHTFHKDKSLGEEEHPRASSFLHWCTQSCISDLISEDDNSQSGGTSKDGTGGGKGKELHWAAEEEEESSEDLDSSMLSSITQYRKVGVGAHGGPHPAGLMEDLWPGTKCESSITDKDWGTPVPIPSCSPTAVLRGPSKESEVLSILESTKHSPELWKDWEALSKALAKLVEQSCDLQLDITLHACLTRMKGVLNIYLDPNLSYGWTDASLMVAKVEGHGVKQAHKL